MNPKHWAWWILPMFGILAGWIFRTSEEFRLPHPRDAKVETRLLVLPDGRAMRFLRGPSMSIFLSQTEVPGSWTEEFQSEPLSHTEAKSFADHLSTMTGKSLRLPTAAEWRTAARAGVPSAEFPWGFGADLPTKKIHFDLSDAPNTFGPKFGYGFCDLAGGVWEWTEEGILLGSAWSEANPETLRIEYQWNPPEGYRGKDAGVRLVWE